MSCLVIKNDGIGDLILSSGVLSEVSKHFDGDMDLVTCEQNREIVDMIPGVRNTFYVSRDNLKYSHARPKQTPTDNDKQTLLQIAGIEYDQAICLRRFIRESSLMIMNCVSAKEKFCCWQMPTNAGFADATRLSVGWTHFDGDKYTLSELEYYWQFCSKILNKSIDAMPELTINAFDSETNYEEKKLAIGISEGTVKLSKSLWLSIVDQLLQQGWEVHLFGDTNQIELSEIICRSSPKLKLVSHVGELSLAETTEILGRFNYYIGNDTGLSHLASLVVPKVLIILGGGTFARFFPWPNRPDQYAIFFGLDCFDCNWQCKFSSKYCLELITADKLVNYFSKIEKGVKLPPMINLGNKNAAYKLLWNIHDDGQGEMEFSNFV